MLQDYTDTNGSKKALSCSYVKIKGLGILSFLLAILLPLILLTGLYLGLKNTVLKKQPSKKSETISVAANVIEEGKSYEKLSAKITSHPEVQAFISKDPNRVQLIEFFSYACYGCSRLHPFIEEWVATRKPPDLVFYRMPIVFKKGWDVLAKAYYVVSELNRHDMDKDFFEAVQEKNINLSDEQLLKQFFVEHGISGEKFLELFHSFNTNQTYHKVENLNKAYQISISPVLILNLPSGSYLLTTNKAGGNKELLQVLDHLLDKERESGALAAKAISNQNHLTTKSK